MQGGGGCCRRQGNSCIVVHTGNFIDVLDDLGDCGWLFRVWHGVGVIR